MLAVLSPVRVCAHDIPNQRVDRSIQVTLRPGILDIDYEVSLTELTLTQDLRSLIGSLPGGNRAEWLDRYGAVTGPLNAKGFLISCDGRPVGLDFRGFDLKIEEHPRYTFHLVARLPEEGRLIVQDTNYVSSEGTSRLAVRARGDVSMQTDDLPSDVESIPVRPVWQLSDEEELRTKKVELDFRSNTGPSASSRPEPVVPVPVTESATGDTLAKPSAGAAPFSRLLDRDASSSWLGLILIAVGLGAVHAVQPGHGKTIVTAVALGPETRWYEPALLGLFTTLAHTGSVLILALILWYTGATRVVALHRALTHAAGFAIAAGGFWRLGRHLGNWSEHADHESRVVGRPSLGGLMGLGLAGGLVPCWDAVGLVVLSAALGRVGTGVLLVVAFGLGMAGVLVAVGLVAARLKSAVLISGHSRAWESRLGLASSAILAAIGLLLFLS